MDYGLPGTEPGGMERRRQVEREILVCAFTGHRPEKLPWRENEADPRCLALKQRLAGAVEQAYAQGARRFICGMARGADFYFCEAVIALRRRAAPIVLEGAIPFAVQADRWKEEDRVRYRGLLDECDRLTIVQQKYDRECMLRRDRYMVDRAQMLLAVYNGMPGGTRYTIAYAMSRGAAVTILDL